MGQGLLDGAAHALVDVAAVPKAHLNFGGVDVDIDPRRLDLHEQDIGRLALSVQHIVIGTAHGVLNDFVAHITPVDIRKLLIGA